MKKYDGELIKDKIDGELLKDESPKGDLIVSEGPKGNKLWKNKDKINEEAEKNNLNESSRNK
jgi:hypothetical protein